MTDIDLERAKVLFDNIILYEGGAFGSGPSGEYLKMKLIKETGQALITEVKRLRKELTVFYQQDNQEHRLIAQIERLEWWKEHGQKLRNAIAEMDNSATTDQEIEKAPLKMKDELKRLRELGKNSYSLEEVKMAFFYPYSWVQRKEQWKTFKGYLFAKAEEPCITMEIEKEMG